MLSIGRKSNRQFVKWMRVTADYMDRTLFLKYRPVWSCYFFTQQFTHIDTSALTFAFVNILSHYAPAPKVGALSDDARLTSVCLVHRA